MDPQAKSYGPVILDASRLGKQNMLENKRFWLVIITYFRVVLFHKVWWMGFEKGNIHFILGSMAFNFSFFKVCLH